MASTPSRPAQARLVRFHKLHGCGNDFIFLDRRDPALARVTEADMPRWATALCRRAFSIGADGLIFLDPVSPDPACDHRWHFFNADGSRAEMCGNASRCAGRLAVQLGLAGPEHVMLTDAGPVAIQVLGVNRVKVRLTPATDLATNIPLELAGVSRPVHFANTGVPHAVVIDPDVWSLDLKTLGPALRRHPHFGPKGTNANFIQVLDRQTIHLRTWERGVEDETYACGTGAAASVVVAHALGLADATVNVTTTGKEVLGISLQDGHVCLEGGATHVCSGEFDPAENGLPTA